LQERAKAALGRVSRNCVTARRPYSAANEIYADLSKSHPHFARMYASLTAYRSDSLMWMQVAELSFDSFMMRMRTRSRGSDGKAFSRPVIASVSEAIRSRERTG
jgi:hypothetical protein